MFLQTNAFFGLFITIIFLGENFYVPNFVGFHQIRRAKDSANRVLITEDFETVLDCEQQVNDLKSKCFTRCHGILNAMPVFYLCQAKNEMPP
jgi:hypothetical protein